MVYAVPPRRNSFTPLRMWGCGETRISHNAQLQKWKYLHSAAHLGKASADTVSALIQRALTADPSAPTVYCTSLVEWGHRMGLSLKQAPTAALPQAVKSFIEHAMAPHSRRIYTDGSFAVDAPPLDALTLSSTELTAAFGVVAASVISPRTSSGSPSARHPPAWHSPTSLPT